MYHHPLLTGLLGTAATFCSLATVFLLVWLRSTELPVQVGSEGMVGWDLMCFRLSVGIHPSWR